MPKKSTDSDDLMTTIARGVGSTVGKIANTAQRLAETASSEIAKHGRSFAKKAKRSKPRTSVKKKAAKKASSRKSGSKAKKKAGRAKV